MTVLEFNKTITPRPQVTFYDVYKAACELKRPEYVEPDFIEISYTDVECNDIASAWLAMNWCTGFDMCIHLARYKKWDNISIREQVSFDRLPDLVLLAHKENVKNWLDKNKIVATHKVTDSIDVDLGHMVKEGVVVGVDYVDAHYYAVVADEIEEDGTSCLFTVLFEDVDASKYTVAMDVGK